MEISLYSRYYNANCRCYLNSNKDNWLSSGHLRSASRFCVAKRADILVVALLTALPIGKDIALSGCAFAIVCQERNIDQI
jgi:hypothetical protein